MLLLLVTMLYKPKKWARATNQRRNLKLGIIG
jgi:hypothetical protein